VVNGQICFFEDWSEFKLVWCNLVVASLARDAEFESLISRSFMKACTRSGMVTEVVVVHLLVLGTVMSHQGTAGEDEVWTSSIEVLVNEEVFLFPTEVGDDLLYVGIEIMADIGSSYIHSVQGAQQRSFVVEGLTGVRDEYGRNTKCVIHDEHRACWIPSRITASLEGVADAAGGKAEASGSC
jgi:hypothetical protein